MTKTEAVRSKEAEKLLSIVYSFAIALSCVSVISLTVAWQHWAWTLNSCIDVHCECILYGVNTFSTFMGGDVKLCHFAAYGLTPAILVALVLAIYHASRSCFHRELDEPRILNTRDDSNSIDGTLEVVVRPKTNSLCKQWIPAAFLAAVISCLSLAHAVLMTDGYYKTCDQYRRNLIEMLGSRGREVQVIYNRLSCGAIFDFMDYLEPDSNNWRRGDEINTGVALQFAIAASWLHFFTFLFAALLNFIMGRRRHRMLDEKSCCYFC